MERFIHLRLHSEYSIANGIVRIPALINAVKAAGMPAVAVTDQTNLFGMVKFFRAARAQGIKPIIGAELFLHHPQDPTQPTRVVLLCQNKAGYLHLSHLISRSYMEGQYHGRATVEFSWLAESAGGLIALSGGRDGEIGRAVLSGDPALAHETLERWRAVFGDRLYLELQRTGRAQEEGYIQAILPLALQYRLPVVATNDVHFLSESDFEAHEARVCIHEGRTLDDPHRSRRFSRQQYLRTPAEMAALFADIPEALSNTVEIAKRCNLELRLGQPVLPDFPLPAGMTAADYLRQEAEKGLRERLAVLAGGNPDPEERPEREQTYFSRLNAELDVIISMGFAGYFLIVADFIRWAKENDVPVGPGRGSGAGSLVAYALRITDLDPIRYDLLFERFLNPERVSMPDFDVDFCMDKRDAVIDYVVRRYGKERVSQIITYGTMAAKAVVRDVGRVLGHPYGFVDKIAKLIPFELGMTLSKALEQEEQLRQRYEEEDEVRQLIDLAMTLEGVTRNAGKHAGGVVIAPTALSDFTPLVCEPGGANAVTQFDKDDVEAVGLVKFDFLGLRTLTIIDWALASINAQRQKSQQPPLDITQIPLDDAQTFALLKNCRTTAVFQLESRGMKDLIKRLAPDCFEDIIALVALFRPGPLQSGMVDDFINRKHGRTRVEYPHPDLAPILKPTYGVILYQEQVMQIAQVLAGYTLGGADLLRRAMGKKKPEEMAKQREIFIEGAKARRVDAGTASSIFDLMEKFAGYGFNKSHSAAYALLSYQTAWLKAHYPADFMAAVLSADMDHTDKIVNLIDECRAMNLSVRPPDVNLSTYRFSVTEDGRIQYGLGAIKGVGQSAIDGIVNERQRRGPFTDLFDFCRRVDLGKVNRRNLEALIRSGAMDCFGQSRATLMAWLGEAVQAAEQFHRDRAAGQSDLFGGGGEPVVPAVSGKADRTELPEWEDAQRLAGEKETLGLYLTGHPINAYKDELKQFVTCDIADLKPDHDQSVVIAGLVVASRTMTSRRGDRMAFITLDDRSGRVELAVFPENYKKYRDLLVKDKLVVVAGQVSVDEYSGGYRISSDEIFDIDGARANYAKRLVIELEEGQRVLKLVPQLQALLQRFRHGHCPVWVRYRNQAAMATVVFGDQWRVRPESELLEDLGRLMSPRHVSLQYS